MQPQSLRIITTAVCAAVLFTSSLFGQKPSPNPSPDSTKSPFQMPDMGAMYSQMMNAMFSEYIKPERATQLAHFQKLYYDALIKEGFTKEEALEIIKASPLPPGGK